MIDSTQLTLCEQKSVVAGLGSEGLAGGAGCLPDCCRSMSKQKPAQQTQCNRTGIFALGPKQSRTFSCDLSSRRESPSELKAAHCC